MKESLNYLEKLITYTEKNIDSFNTYRLLILTIILNLNEGILSLNKEDLNNYRNLLIRYTNLKRNNRKYLKSENRLLREYKKNRLDSLKSRVNK